MFYKGGCSIINNLLARKQIYQVLVGIFVIASIIFLVRPDDAMLGFWGGIIGGIAGGLFTFGGVYIGINEQRKRDYYSSLPDKIMMLDDLITANMNALDMRSEAEDARFKIDFFLENNPLSNDLGKFRKENPDELFGDIYQQIIAYQKIIENEFVPRYKSALFVDVQTYKEFRSNTEKFIYTISWVLFCIETGVNETDKENPFSLTEAFQLACEAGKNAVSENALILAKKKKYYSEELDKYYKF